MCGRSYVWEVICVGGHMYFDLLGDGGGGLETPYLFPNFMLSLRLGPHELFSVRLFPFHYLYTFSSVLWFPYASSFCNMYILLRLYRVSMLYDYET